MPRGPAFNEGDVSDKASPWRNNPRLSEECPEGYPEGYRDEPQSQCLRAAIEHWRDRMESLRGIDDLVGRRAAALREEGALKNTYIVFSSDNGFQMYDNRVFSKGASYEDSHGVPLIVRGPGVAAGRTDGRLVANIDLAPTFADWAGARTPSSVDGRSLVPVLSDPRAPWRTRLLFEHRLGNHAYDAIRTSSDEVYIEYPCTDETEYYGLKEDPYQLDGQAGPPPPTLERQLQTLKDCAAGECRRVDAGASSRYRPSA